jgi:hypothetical protein
MPAIGPSDGANDPTWHGLVALPDDVSLYTRDRHQETLRRAYKAWSHWTTLVLDVQSLCADAARDPLAVAAVGAGEEFQASTYAALTGFYRQAIGGLRSVLETTLAGLYFKVQPNDAVLDKWLEGAEDRPFPTTTTRRTLSRTEPFCSLGKGDEAFLADNGWFASLYALLCAFIHGRPAHTNRDGISIETTNGGMWRSNGPVYVQQAFAFWSALYFDTMLLGALLCGLADQRLVEQPGCHGVIYETYVERLMEWHPHPKAPITAAVIAEYLMPPTRSS